MPNPNISPAWAADATYSVTDSDFVALDIRLAELDEEDGEVELTIPAGGEVRVVRDPASWAEAGAELLGAGGWAAVPVALGNWTVTVNAGVAVTDPATIAVSNGDGSAPAGLLRLVMRSLGGAATGISPGGGTLSIDRVLADPSIVSPQVTSPTPPVRELDPVSIGATAGASVEANPAPTVPLSAVPAVLSAWSPDPSNPVALGDFASAGSTANFTAPPAYDTIDLLFRFTAAYDLASSGVIDPDDPANAETLDVKVNTIGFGMLLVLDRSGSMGGALGNQTKWDAAVQAAHAWLDLFRSFRTGEGHLAGVVTFEHDSCTWTLSSDSDVTLRDPATGSALDSVTKPMSALADLGNQAVLQLGTPQSCTPIGDALIEGLQALQVNLQPDDKGALVLLTDGYENAGAVTIAAQRGDAQATFDDEREAPAYAYGNDLLGDRLFTIGVGSSVDEDRLNNLAKGVGYYRLMSDVGEILPGFAEMLGQLLDAQASLPTVVGSDPDSPPNALYFEVSTGEQRVALLVPWTSATDTLRVGFRLQGTTDPFTLVSGGDEAVIASERRQFHGLMTVDLTALLGTSDPPATEWRVQHLSNSGGGEPTPQPLSNDDVLCMVDLVTKASIRFDREQYFIGDPIKLSCSIRSRGLPVTGATVGVDVAKPGEGLGTFLATNAKLYKRPQGGPNDVSAVPNAGPDPDQGKGLMFKTLLSRLELPGLPVVTPPDFKLLDDGAHDDGAADDGDYANAFTDTDKEGSYTFRFRIEGTLPDGSRYSRVFVRSTWVGVRPDPSQTLVTWTALDLSDGQLGHLLTFTPQSSNGELLGPFRTAVIDLSVDSGTADGPLIDNLDGSYSQRVLSRTGEDPIVSIEIYGTRLKPTGPTLKPFAPGRGCVAAWIDAFACLWKAIFGR